jgi:hypothetical protein
MVVILCLCCCLKFLYILIPALLVHVNYKKYNKTYIIYNIYIIYVEHSEVNMYAKCKRIQQYGNCNSPFSLYFVGHYTTRYQLFTKHLKLHSATSV